MLEKKYEKLFEDYKKSYPTKTTYILATYEKNVIITAMLFRQLNFVLNMDSHIPKLNVIN